MSNNITYYLGAGASYNSQPLLATMKDRMLLLLNHLNEEKNQESMDQPLFNVAGTQKLYDKYKQIVIAATTHHTPDTYAKKLWLTNQINTLNIFKEFLQLYFLFEQDVYKDAYINKVIIDDSREMIVIDHNGTEHISSAELHFNKDEIELWKKIDTVYDDRYDVFFATLLTHSPDDNKKLILPSNINIISWNYDNQFELAYERFLGIKEGITKQQSSMSNLNIMPSSFSDVYDSDNYILKLNGQCKRLHFDIVKKPIYLSFKSYLEALTTNETVTIPLTIKFAWEEFDVFNPKGADSLNRKVINKSKEIISKTNKLVIIGYSFPNFNRDIDNEILGYESDFDEIIVQDPNEDSFQNIKESLLNILGSDFESMIKHKKGVDQFYIPF